MVPGEAVLYGEFVETEDLPQQTAVGTVLAALSAVYIIPDKGSRVGQVTGKFFEADLGRKLA